MVHDLAERAHFEMRVGALDAQDLAGFLGALDEFAQILVRGIVGVEAGGLAFFQHGGVLSIDHRRLCHDLTSGPCPMLSRSVRLAAGKLDYLGPPFDLILDDLFKICGRAGQYRAA